MNRIRAFPMIQYALKLVLLALIGQGLGSARVAMADEAGRPSRSAARALFEMLNQERARAGLNRLDWDNRLAAAAESHAEQMASHQQLSHDFGGEPPLQQRISKVPLTTSGENVGVGPTIPDIHQGLMHSPPHRANILNRQFDAVGIGVIQQNGHYWVAQDFARRISQMPDAQAESDIVAAALRVRPDLHSEKNSRVHQLACRMARAGELDEQRALELPGVRRVVAYTSTNPEQLPDDAHRALTPRDTTLVGTGACFARTPQYPSGVYWVLMVLFGK